MTPILLLFLEKKHKSLPYFTEHDSIPQTIYAGSSEKPMENHSSSDTLLFHKQAENAVPCRRQFYHQGLEASSIEWFQFQKTVLYKNFGKAPLGSLAAGRWPPRANWSKGVLLFPEKEAKSVSPASQKTVTYRKLGEADPEGLGACSCSQELIGLKEFF
jgi:hypothetical protein